MYIECAGPTVPWHYMRKLNAYLSQTAIRASKIMRLLYNEVDTLEINIDGHRMTDY